MANAAAAAQEAKPNIMDKAHPHVSTQHLQKAGKGTSPRLKHSPVQRRPVEEPLMDPNDAIPEIDID
jgi:hypothetical protein